MNQQVGTTDHSINFDLKNDIDDLSKNIGNISIINNSKIHENLTTNSQMEMDDILLKMMLDDPLNKKNAIPPNSQPQHSIYSSVQLGLTSNLSHVQHSSQKHLQEVDVQQHVTSNVEVPIVYKHNPNHYYLNQSSNIHQITDKYDNNNSNLQQRKKSMNDSNHQSSTLNNDQNNSQKNSQNNGQNNGQNIGQNNVHNNNHNNNQNNVQNSIQPQYYYNQQYSNSDLRSTDPNKNRKLTDHIDLQNFTLNGNTCSLTNLNSNMNHSIKHAVHQNYVEQEFSKE